MTNKRARLSTTASQIKLAQGIDHGIEPSEALSPDELLVFQDILKARETSTWTDHDVRVATGLARQTVLHAQLVKIVADEGVLYDHPRKGLVAHPAIAAACSLGSSIKAQTTQLGLSASQRGLAGAKQQVRNQHEQSVRSAFADKPSFWA